MIYFDLILISQFWKDVYTDMFVVFRMCKANHIFEVLILEAAKGNRPRKRTEVIMYVTTMCFPDQNEKSEFFCW
jgi:hypothetical protein